MLIMLHSRQTSYMHFLSNDLSSSNRSTEKNIKPNYLSMHTFNKRYKKLFLQSAASRAHLRVSFSFHITLVSQWKNFAYVCFAGLPAWALIDSLICILTRQTRTRKRPFLSLIMSSFFSTIFPCLLFNFFENLNFFLLFNLIEIDLLLHHLLTLFYLFDLFNFQVSFKRKEKKTCFLLW